MTYNKTIWENDITPVSASNMNKIEDKIEALDNETVELKTYSTTEIAVGTWVDGKTIYRKVFIPYQTQSYAASTSYTINVGSGIDKIIRWDVLTTGNNNNNQEVNKYVIPGRFTKSSNSITIDSTATYSTNVTHVILEYTKTS